VGEWHKEGRESGGVVGKGGGVKRKGWRTEGGRGERKGVGKGKGMKISRIRVLLT